MRGLVSLVALVALIPTAAGADFAPPTGGEILIPEQRGLTIVGTRASTSFTIHIWPQGKQRASRPVRWTLACDPARGTLPRAARACRRLLALRRPFRPVPRGAVCTEIYGGPQVAEVRGRFRGRRVSSQFTRTDGCEIERWNRVSFLFPR